MSKKHTVHPLIALIFEFVAAGAGAMYAGQLIWAVLLLASQVGLLAMLWLAVSGGVSLLICYYAGIGVVILWNLVRMAAAVFLALKSKRSEVNVSEHHNWLVVGWFVMSLVVSVSATFVFESVESLRIRVGSMQPTLRSGEHILSNKTLEREDILKRGTIVQFEFPTESARSYLKTIPAQDRDCIGEGTLDALVPPHFVSRIVGLPGDQLQVRENAITIDGKAVEVEVIDKESTGNHLFPESFIGRERLGDRDHLVKGINFESYRDIDYTVPEGHVFVMSDHRSNASDSRCWGPVPIESLLGRIEAISLSPSGLDYDWSRVGPVQ